MTHQDHIAIALQQLRSIVSPSQRGQGEAKIEADAYRQKINYHLNHLHQQLQSLNINIEANPTIDPWEIQERDNLQQFITTTEIEIEQFLTKQ